MSPYEVGVAITSLGQRETLTQQERASGSVPGYEDLRGTSRRGVIVEKGEEVVSAATEALATQIAISAERIARVISARIPSTSRPGDVALESVEVSFGITLAAGLQTIFTTQAESSAQVTITLRRQAENPTADAS